MTVPRILAGACVTSYLLAMCLPSLTYQNAQVRGWELAYICAMLSFAQSMDLGDRAPFIFGTVSNLLFLGGITFFLGRTFWRWSWPHDAMASIRMSHDCANGIDALTPEVVAICLISVTCLIFSVFSASFASLWQSPLHVGFFLWILSPILLLLGSLNKWWQQGSVRVPDDSG
jgi:hypothetical protein